MVVLAADWAPLALRLMLGVIFLAHGYPKVKNLKNTAGWLASSGFKPGMFWAVVLGFTEFIGAIALLVGFLTRVAAGLLIVSMTVATLMQAVKWKKPFTSQAGPGYEFDLLIVAGLVALFLWGAGNWSVDQAIGWILG